MGEMQPEEKVEIKEAVKKALDTDMVAQDLPRVVHGERDSPYMLEVTVTRQSDIIPADLIEININKSPKVSEERARDVIQHALIDVFGEFPPYFVVELPSGAQVPAYDWFDHANQFNLRIGMKFLRMEAPEVTNPDHGSLQCLRDRFGHRAMPRWLSLIKVTK